MTDYYGHMTKKDGTHVPLTKEMAKALWESAERNAEDRARLMPTSRDAMSVILEAKQRLNALGWRKGLGLRVACGAEVAVREDGSTGIWGGWVNDDGKYVLYCDSVSDPRRVWLKPISQLTEDERKQMEECDRDGREWQDLMIKSHINQDEAEGEPR